MKHPIPRAARDAVEAIIADLNDRSGCGIDSLDDELQAEIRAVWERKIVEALSKQPPVIEVGQLHLFYRKGDLTVTMRAATRREVVGYVVRVDNASGQWSYRQHWRDRVEAERDFAAHVGFQGGWVVRYAVHHPEMGVFLGSALGMGFWSKLDAVGQTEAVLFGTPGKARDFIDSLKVDGRTKDACEVYPVAIEINPARTDPDYATVAEIEAAGLPRWEPGDHTPITDAEPVDVEGN